MTVRVKLFKNMDLDQIMEIEVECFSDPWPSSFFRYSYQKSPNLFLVAFKKENILGYIIGEIREIIFSGVSHMLRMGHILNLAVHKSNRRKNSGLMSYCAKLSKS